MVATMEAPAPTKHRSPTAFDPARATFVNEIRVQGVWRAEYACSSSRAGHAPHRLIVGPDGHVFGCSCEAYWYAPDDAKACPHARAAAAIIRVATANFLAGLADDDVERLLIDLRDQFGTAGLAHNIRADVVADEWAARLRRRDGFATIALGHAAVSDLFDEAM